MGVCGLQRALLEPREVTVQHWCSSLVILVAQGAADFRRMHTNTAAASCCSVTCSRHVLERIEGCLLLHLTAVPLIAAVYERP